MGTAALQDRRFRLSGAAVVASLTRVFERIHENRQAKAEAYVRSYLARLTETELRDAGFGPAEVEAIKASKDVDLRYQL